MSEPGLHSIFNILLEGEESGWIQMLVFAVIIGLSAISRFAAQRKQKRNIERQEQARRQPPQPADRRQLPSRAAEQHTATPPQHPRPTPQPRQHAPGKARPKTIIRPGGALSQFVAEIKQEIQRAAEEMQAVQAPPPPPAKPKPPETPQPTPPAPEIEKPQRFLSKKAPKPKEQLEGIVPQFADADDLKRAIIYLEILGKPVSLRKPTENLIGL